MRKAAAVFTFAAVLMLSSATGALAASFVSDTSWSWLCISICGSSSPTSTAVTPTPSPWAIPTTGTWISTSNTNADGTGPALSTEVKFTSPVIHFGAGSVLSFQVWADDTAEVFLDGSTSLSLLNAGSAPNTTLDGACAAGTLGCEASEFGQFSTGALTGDHTISVQVSQLLAATPFGTLVEGDLSPSAVPEPATILLLGSALATAGVVSRRRFRKTGSES